MSTVETTADSHDEHDDDHHDHGEFIAHHFDSAEQQFDSGKLGIWVFLVTEVLFFSGLFVAYTLYRYHHPEVFVDASQFLDKVLGGINTVVLLFSSLTMAWAVRAAQLGNNNFAGKLILITMVCAAAFLGIKAVEYSHKWDLYILPVSYYNYMEGTGNFEKCIQTIHGQEYSRSIEVRHHGFLLGNVVDMFQFNVQWPTSIPYVGGKQIFPAIWNFADFCISSGVGMILIRNRTYFPKEKK